MMMNILDKAVHSVQVAHVTFYVTKSTEEGWYNIYTETKEGKKRKSGGNFSSYDQALYVLSKKIHKLEDILERKQIKAMKYYYRLWCPDCCGQDYEGCFDGRIETSPTPYNTPQEANEAGQNETRGFIWKYEVVDELGCVIEIGD